jgi:hypothetical protein
LSVAACRGSKATLELPPESLAMPWSDASFMIDKLSEDVEAAVLLLDLIFAQCQRYCNPGEVRGALTASDVDVNLGAS